MRKAASRNADDHLSGPSQVASDMRPNADVDVDHSDFGIFQRCLSGEDVPADPECAN